MLFSKFSYFLFFCSFVLFFFCSKGICNKPSSENCMFCIQDWNQQGTIMFSPQKKKKFKKINNKQKKRKTLWLYYLWYIVLHILCVTLCAWAWWVHLVHTYKNTLFTQVVICSLTWQFWEKQTFYTFLIWFATDNVILPQL